MHPVPDLFWGTGDGNKTGKNIFGKLLQDTLDFQIKRRNLHTHNHTSPLSRPLTQPNQQSRPNPPPTPPPSTTISQTHTRPRPQPNNLIPSQSTSTKTNTSQPNTSTWSKAGTPRPKQIPKQTNSTTTQNRFSPLHHHIPIQFTSSLSQSNHISQPPQNLLPPNPFPNPPTNHLNTPITHRKPILNPHLHHPKPL